MLRDLILLRLLPRSLDFREENQQTEKGLLNNPEMMRRGGSDPWAVDFNSELAGKDL